MNKVGRYQLLEEMGRGGMGMVYRAFDPTLRRFVAIKTIRLDLFAHPSEQQELRDRFCIEAQAAAALSHPNIVTIYDYGDEGQIAYIVMELIEGGNLTTLVEKGKPIGAKECIRFLNEASAALDHAAIRDVVHRDVKPGNILIRRDGTAKLCDFGIAKLTNMATSVTRSGVLIGTTHYISPEQLRGAPVSGATDQYALAVVVYELLSGRRPFDALSLDEHIARVLQEPPVPLSSRGAGLPLGLDDVFNRALSKKPEERFGSCTEFALAVGKELGAPISHQVSVQPSPRGQETTDQRQRRFHSFPDFAVPSTWWIVGAFAFLFVFIGGYLLWRTPTNESRASGAGKGAEIVAPSPHDSQAETNSGPPPQGPSVGTTPEATTDTRSQPVLNTPNRPSKAVSPPRPPGNTPTAQTDLAQPSDRSDSASQTPVLTASNAEAAASPAPPTPGAVGSANSAPPDQTVNREETDWNNVDQTSPEAIRNFLGEYPNGRHSADARVSLARIARETTAIRGALNNFAKAFQNKNLEQARRIFPQLPLTFEQAMRARDRLSEATFDFGEPLIRGDVANLNATFSYNSTAGNRTSPFTSKVSLTLQQQSDVWVIASWQRVGND